MASSDVDICAQALALLRANTIDSLSEGTDEAQICALFYPAFARDILTRRAWTFATKKRMLNQTAAPVNEYRYAHIIPIEKLKLWAVFSSGAVGAKPINDYDVQSPDTNTQVFSNHEQLWAEYTVYKAESQWPGYFEQFAVEAFAARIAMPVTDQPELADYWSQKAWGNPSEGGKGGSFGIAANIDSQEKPPEVFLDDPFNIARFN